MNVLITGAGGQLAWELSCVIPAGMNCLALGVDALDITNRDNVAAVFNDFKPAIVINAAAYTAVDKAESEQALAFAVNHEGAKNLSCACLKANAFLFQVSTDFVFDGTQNTPYNSTDKANPLSVYGASKLAGDEAVSEILGEKALIVRTAWVYSVHGNNFVKTMLRLMQEKSELGIVYDQVGSPTWAKGLAQWLWSMVANVTLVSYKAPSNTTPIYHWTDAGIASWYDFAVAIQELAIEKGILSKSIPIRSIPASSYPTPAKRPAFSVLAKQEAEQVSGLNTIHWRKQLSAMLDSLHDVKQS